METSFEFVSVNDGGITTHYPKKDAIIVTTVEEAVRQFTRPDKSLSLWAIFDHPKDFPEGFVVRENVVTRGDIYISPIAIHAGTLAEARRILPPFMSRIPRQDGDPQFLIETWL